MAHARMIVDDLRTDAVGDGLCELSARMRPAAAPERRLWWRLPEQWAPPRPDGSPFVAAAWVWALVHGEGLETDVPVCAELAENLEALADRYCARGVQRPRALPAPPLAEAAPGHPLTGCFFGLGVDSWFAVLVALEDEPQTPPLTHLVFSPDFVSDSWPREAIDPYGRAASVAAEAVGCELIEVGTNIRRELSSGHNRVNLAATALALGLQRALVPSNQGLAENRAAARRAHAMPDPRLSTRRVGVVHYGDANRVEKVARIAAAPRALGSLYVCGRRGSVVEGNCGSCEKCVRTMLALHLAGALEACPTFTTSALDGLASLRKPLNHRRQLRTMLRLLGEGAEDRRLAAATRLAIAQSDLSRAGEELRLLAGDPHLPAVSPSLPGAVEGAADLAAAAHEALGPKRRSWRAAAARALARRRG